MLACTRLGQQEQYQHRMFHQGLSYGKEKEVHRIIVTHRVSET
jgi:hypothetical protein